MKVFISWSGHTSHKAALALKDWLPNVLQTSMPFVSSEDIEKGERWSSKIASNLEESEFGIICVTPSNINSRWLNFEAGALSRDAIKDRVSPLIIGLDQHEVSGPLSQFQSTFIEKHEITQLVKSINRLNPTSLRETALERAVDKWWDEFEHLMLPLADEARKNRESGPVASEPLAGAEYVVETLLPAITALREQLSPESVLPPSFVEEALRNSKLILIEGGIDEKNLIELSSCLRGLRSAILMSNGALVSKDLIDKHLSPVIDSIQRLINLTGINNLRVIKEEEGKVLRPDGTDDLRSRIGV